MALKLTKTDTNGVALSYHRVNGIFNYTNVLTRIELTSYISQETRENERTNFEMGYADITPVYLDTVYYETEYKDGITIKDAYEYLKTLDEFAGAEDVLE
jgi:hypothetical protein